MNQKEDCITSEEPLPAGPSNAHDPPTLPRRDTNSSGDGNNKRPNSPSSNEPDKQRQGKAMKTGRGGSSRKGNNNSRRSKMILDWVDATKSTIDGTSESCSANKSVHPGSFANPSQRERFNKIIPYDLLDAMTGSSSTQSNLSPEEGKVTANVSSQPEKHDSNAKRTKRKFAILLGYFGSDYGGFQMNEGQSTVQAEVELALLRSNLILPSNFGHPWKYGWSTSGRTDKGVHACGQVVSCKLEVPPSNNGPGDEEQAASSENIIRLSLNEQLPSQIRVLDVVRTTRNFCAKTQRHRVRYQYMIPSFLLQDFDRVFLSLNHRENATTSDKDSEPAAADELTSQEIRQLQSQALVQCRISPEQLDRLRETLRQYQGTHSFHSFTKRLSPQDDRAKRFIESFEAHDPILLPIHNNGSDPETTEECLEWIPTTVVGQSFLLHQIRKMIGLAVQLVRRYAMPSSDPNNYLDRLHHVLESESMMNVPRAPAQGLFLDMSFYNGYNQRKNANQDLQDIEWDKESTASHDRYKAFQQRVLEHIGTEELREGNFLKYYYREYQNAKRRSTRTNGDEDDDEDAKSCASSSSNNSAIAD